MEKLAKCEANHTALTPISFLKRAAMFYADRTSLIYGNVRFSWAQTYQRCLRLASSLHSLDIRKNDVVSVLAPNIPALYEMHFAVPMAGAVLNTINTRLDANTIKTILHHSAAKLFFIDYQYVPLAEEALRLLALHSPSSPLPVPIVIDDAESPTGVHLGPHNLHYDHLILTGNPDEHPDNCHVADEWDPITLNYTSGTTSAPKGVVYSQCRSYVFKAPGEI